MTKQETINRIRNRINKEYKKHKEIDWQTIAAHKIYATLFERCKNCGGVVSEVDTACQFCSIIKH